MVSKKPVTPKKPKAVKKAKAPKKAKPDDGLLLLDAEFEFALLERNELQFPITDGRKLNKYHAALQRIARNKMVDELARQGYTIRDIAARMTALGWKGVTRPNVFLILKKNLEIIANDAAFTIAQRKQLELNKIDQAELAHFARFLGETDPDAAEKLSRVIERIWKRRDMLEGRTQKVEVTGQEGGPIEVATRVIFPAAVSKDEQDDSGDTDKDG